MGHPRHLERRISQMHHPDLPDLSPHPTISSKHSVLSRSSWRPSWFTRSSTSSQSQRSSLATLQSDGSSTRTADADEHTVYQLPIVTSKDKQILATLDEPAPPIIPTMKYEFEDETFDFPVPIAAAHRHSQSEAIAEVGPASRLDALSPGSRSNDTSSRMTIRSKASKVSSGGESWAASSKPTSANSLGHFDARNLHEVAIAEIEMVSKEKYGYWNASFLARINAAAAVCGAVLLAVKLPHGPPEGINILSGGFCEATAAAFSSELCQTGTPNELMHVVRRHGLGSLALILKTSLDGPKTPGVPLTVAMAISKKMRDITDRSRLWSQVLKLLKKIPQDSLVLLIFLTSIARRLEQGGMTIDGYEPSRHLLKGLWPCALASSEDPLAGQRISRLLVQHCDDFPAAFPVVLQAVNYRFASGKRYNVLALMAENKRLKTGTRGVHEIAMAEHSHRPFQW